MTRSPQCSVALLKIGQDKHDTEPYIKPNSMIGKSPGRTTFPSHGRVFSPARQAFALSPDSNGST